MSELNRDETMTLARLTTMLGAYGASPQRWPADERSAAETLLASNLQAQTLLAEARALDVALDNAAVPDMRSDLATRIMAAFDEVAAKPSVRKVIDRIASIVWPGVPVWKPSAAFAVSLLAGLVLGVFAPFGGATGQSPNSDIAVAFDVQPSDGL